MNSAQDTFTLANGYKIPVLGFGTWKAANGDEARDAVKCAIKNGYRHIDTAAIYKNEASVGQAIQESDVKREELFVTSKVWNTERGYDKTMKAFEKTLADLKLDYLDLYLIHWPAAPHQYDNWDELNLETWSALIELYKAGKVKAIGVSNFKPHHLKSLMQTEIVPMVNQIEYHPGFMQEETVKFCKEHNILVEAWRPLGAGLVLEDERMHNIASKYGRTVAQLCIRWCLQNGMLPLPKSVTESRIIGNLKIFDFEISPEDMEQINNFEDFAKSGQDPDAIDF